MELTSTSQEAHPLLGDKHCARIFPHSVTAEDLARPLFTVVKQKQGDWLVFKLVRVFPVAILSLSNQISPSSRVSF